MSEENVSNASSGELPKGLSIAGMVCGIVGLVLSLATCTWIFGIILDVIGLALSGVALNNCKQGKADGRGMAIAGLVTSLVGIVWVLAIFIIAASAASAAANAAGNYDEAMDALRELESMMDSY